MQFQRCGSSTQVSETAVNTSTQTTDSNDNDRTGNQAKLLHQDGRRAPEEPEPGRRARVSNCGTNKAVRLGNTLRSGQEKPGETTVTHGMKPQVERLPPKKTTQTKRKCFPAAKQDAAGGELSRAELTWSSRAGGGSTRRLTGRDVRLSGEAAEMSYSRGCCRDASLRKVRRRKRRIRRRGSSQWGRQRRRGWRFETRSGAGGERLTSAGRLFFKVAPTHGGSAPSSTGTFNHFKDGGLSSNGR